MPLPRLGRRILGGETITDGTNIVVLVTAPTEEIRNRALNAVLFIGGHNFEAAGDGGQGGAGQAWQEFEAQFDVTRGAEAINVFCRGEGATDVAVFETSFSVEDVPVVGDALGAAEETARAGREALGGLADIAKMLPILIVAMVGYLVIQGNVSLKL